MMDKLLYNQHGHIVTLTFTGEPLDTATALEWGLASRAVAPEVPMAEAETLAEKIAVSLPRLLRMAKRLLSEGMTSRLDSLLELAAAYQGTGHQTEGHAEAVDTLLEKPAPRFTGR